MSYGVKQQTDQGEVWQSQFTEHLVSHLSEARSLKQNVTVHGLYRKLHAALQGSRQTPMLFSKGGQSDPDLVIAPRPLPYEDQQEESKAEGWIPLSDAESSRLKQLVPVYLLDSKFHLKDWNPAFESVIARQLRLTRGQHASEFLQSLENWSQVQKISLRDFKEPDIDEQWESDRTKRIPNTYPPVHVERFDFRSQKFGLIVFDKLATQIRDLDGASKTWCVTLNVTFAQKAEEFWHHLKEMTVNESQWSKYAMCYDEIIGAYPEYQNLVKKVVAHVRPALRCLDIGAGTGNSTKAILDQNPKCHVTAIENNEAMLRRFAEKFQRSKNYRDRIRMLRGDALSQLLRLEREEAGKPVGELFDACVMLNVLFVLDDPVEVLKSVRKLLKFGAVLSISNPRKGTDVSKLFKGIQQHLDATGQLEKKKQLWEAAYLRNKEMMPAANRDSLTDLRRYIESAGFVVEGKDIEDSCYHDCVVVIKAINPGPTALAASS
jgi:SAM-dependent methyltransferase